MCVTQQEPQHLQSLSNEILTAIVCGMKKEEPSNKIRLAATNALYNSLEFTKANFEVEVCLMLVIFEFLVLFEMCHLNVKYCIFIDFSYAIVTHAHHYDPQTPIEPTITATNDLDWPHTTPYRMRGTTSCKWFVKQPSQVMFK